MTDQMSQLAILIMSVREVAQIRCCGGESLKIQDYTYQREIGSTITNFFLDDINV